jgi:hypothetical protein
MSLFDHLILSHRTRLISGFEHAIRISMHEAKRRSKKANPEEPDVVAMLVLEGVPYIADSLRAVIQRFGLGCTVSSVFCHQKPTVTFGSPMQGSELGDILFVHRHSDRSGKLVRSNALLLQAKMASGSYTIPPSEQHQLMLYTDWPKFTYTRSGPRLNGASRELQPKIPHLGAQYLLIDDGKMGMSAGGILGFPGTHCMAVFPARPVLHPYISLSDQLIQFLLGTSGKLFLDKPSSDPSGWSEVVWDLLEHSTRFVFNRKNSNIQNASRLGGDAMVTSLSRNNFRVFSDYSTPASRVCSVKKRTEFTNKINALRGGDVPPVNDQDESNNDEGGVSVVLIETRESNRLR